MKSLEVKDLELSGVKTISYERFLDERGYFTETFQKSELEKVLDPTFKVAQINESYSKKNVLRGLHFQYEPKMGKLVRCIQGRLIDIALDIRPNSKTFGKAIMVELKGSRNSLKDTWVWLPEGFAHGVFFTEESLIEYICTQSYAPKGEAGIFPFSPDIDWSLCDTGLKEELVKARPEIIMSEKDQKGFSLTNWLKDPNSKIF